MKKIIVLALLLITFTSCFKGLTPWQAAQGPQKCGRSTH